jgi:molybdate transport system regulatory protein
VRQRVPYDGLVEPRIKLWIEQDGKLALSGYRVRLLRLIDETGSLSEAASRMGLSYRRAWGKLKEIEANLGVKLVESEAGGAGGGGSRLTAQGRRLVEIFERFEHAAERDLAREFSRFFSADRT